MKNKFLISALLIGAIVFTSCEKEILKGGEDVKTTKVTLPAEYTSADNKFITISEGKYTFKNITSGVETKFNAPSLEVIVDEGIYNVSFIGEGSYNIDDSEYDFAVNLQGSEDNVEVIGETLTINIPLIIKEANKTGDFVFSEIFLAGTLNDAGKQYNGDQYIMIHNNSNQVLYADSLIVIESSFVNNSMREVSPDIRDEALTVHFMMMVPGSGTDHPVNPGEYFLIADNAMNHKEFNSNSMDLRKANVEWYSEVSTTDVDNPAVPNCINLHLSAGNFWFASKQGNKSYALARYPENMTTETYLKEYKYDYEMTFNGSTYSKSNYKFPNDWMLDAVNLSPLNGYELSALSKSLDLGYTSIGATVSPSDNFGKAVIRNKDEVNSTAEGRLILIDNDNSTDDFMGAQQASLLK